MTILRFQRLDPRAQAPQRAHDDDAGYDLTAIERKTLVPGGRAVIGTGIALDLDRSQLGWIVPRSGLAAKHGITVVNAPGLIDPGYRGELRVILLNTDVVDPFTVESGMRIAQLVLATITAPEPMEVDVLSETVRGASGLGSTGS